MGLGRGTVTASRFGSGAAQVQSSAPGSHTPPHDGGSKPTIKEIFPNSSRTKRIHFARPSPSVSPSHVSCSPVCFPARSWGCKTGTGVRKWSWTRWGIHRLETIPGKACPEAARAACEKRQKLPSEDVERQESSGGNARALPAAQRCGNTKQLRQMATAKQEPAGQREAACNK